MKKLKRMLLIHWYFFEHEMIEFEQLNFLTGKNSSGKSTIIDAMQLVLLGDTGGTFFNKAADARGNRTLNGYLRCELGDDEASGFRYLRNGHFTSYIALEFYDESKRSYFTSGCSFETFGDNDVQKLFFRFDGQIPEHEFLDRNVPLSIEQLRTYLRGYGANHAYTTTAGKDFREDLCGRLGGLQPGRFSDLLRKAVCFNPNVNIQQFITEFVCGDEEKINVTEMQENIRSYETLKCEADILKRRLDLLSQICGNYDEFSKYQEQEKLYGYLVDRAETECTAEALEKARHEERRLTGLQEEITRQLERADREQTQLRSERDTLRLQLDGNESARRLAELFKEIEDKKRAYGARQTLFKQSADLLERAFVSWAHSLQSVWELADVEAPLVNVLLRERIHAQRAEGGTLLAQIGAKRGTGAEMIMHTSEADLARLVKEVEAYRNRALQLAVRLDEERDGRRKNLQELQREKESLDLGAYTFPQDAINLKEAVLSRLCARFGSAANAVLVAEAAEVTGERWRNAIEGYLHTQKYYVIVAPEHFRAALRVYDAIKREKNVYMTGLVDTEKLQNLNPVYDPGSLAEEFLAENSAVRLFLNFALGRVHKCNSIDELRRNRTSITDEGVLYQNFVVRAMDPKRWQNPAIGGAAKKMRLVTIAGEMRQITEACDALAACSKGFRGMEKILHLSDTDRGQIVTAAEDFRTLPVLREEIRRLEADAASIDRSEIAELQNRLVAREESLRAATDLIRRYERERGSAESELNTCRTSMIPKLEEAFFTQQDNLAKNYPAEWVEQTAAPRYEKERLARESAEEIKNAFPRERSRAENARIAAWDRMRDLRRQYNDVYKQGHDVFTPGNDVYEKEWQTNAEIRLPEYEAKIEDTRQKAIQQFQEDFLSKLQSSIFGAQRQIGELNAAMKGSQFGEDAFRFRVSANPDHKRFYDMITDDMLLKGGYHLFSSQYNTKYGQEIKDLFEILTNDSGVSGYDDYEKRVQMYTDYKTYLNFDLEVIKPNGESERLSKIMGKKSGGETQTPFYIAVLASFAQLYRIGRDKTENTARLIIFDEAFSKMDGKRIIQSIALLRRFGFQAILAAPPDKLPDIGALVDRNLGVFREGRRTCVRNFDPRRTWEDA